jgi:hypothetical protein
MTIEVTTTFACAPLMLSLRFCSCSNFAFAPLSILLVLFFRVLPPRTLLAGPVNGKGSVGGDFMRELGSRVECFSVLESYTMNQCTRNSD